MNPFKPMLAYKLKEKDLSSLKFPLIVQPKLDGIRCVILKGEILSRTLKPIPNIEIRRQLKALWIKKCRPYLMDGELCNSNMSFQEVASNVMSRDEQPKIEYITFDYAFDTGDLLHPYCYRNNSPINPYAYQDINISYKIINNIQDTIKQEEIFLKEGYEGIIIRSPGASYKFGRSTLNEQGLMALKRFEDAEAEIIGVKELQKNENDLEYDERGYAKHSSHRDNMIKMNTLGALIVRGTNGQFKDVDFDVGSGFTDILRDKIWQDIILNPNANSYYKIGDIITYKYQKIGSKNKPRIPVFKGFRKNI